ncbi:MAG: FxsA family protein [Desulfuromonadaceae bacterium]|nr:FxsA family protein [Desulfuromonadaceae bacterium]
MLITLFATIIVVPILEIYVLISAGKIIGLWPTLGLIVLTGIAGAYLLRTQGADILVKIKASLNQGELPTENLIEAAMIFCGGVTLLIPGFCTDILGFALLLPITRPWLKDWLKRYFTRHIQTRTIYIHKE